MCDISPLSESQTFCLKSLEEPTLRGTQQQDFTSSPKRRKLVVPWPEGCDLRGRLIQES